MYASTTINQFGAIIYDSSNNITYILPTLNPIEALICWGSLAFEGRMVLAIGLNVVIIVFILL